MAKKKPSAAAANARGFATTSTPSSAAKKKADADAAAAAAAKKADEEAPPAPRVPNPVAPPKPKKKDLKAAKAAEKAANAEEDALAKIVNDLARDSRVAKIDADIVKAREDAVDATPAALSVKCERALVDYLMSKTPNLFAHDLGSVKRLPVPDTLVNDATRIMRDLHLVYATLESLGFARQHVHHGMARSPQPWDLQETLHHMCLTMPTEHLPRGFADKIYMHQTTDDAAAKRAKQAEEEAAAAAAAAAKRKGRRGRGGKSNDADNDGSSAVASSSTAPPPPPAQPAADPAVDAAASAFDNLDLDTLNVFDLDHSYVATQPAHRTPTVREFSLAGWTGKVPKQLLRDTMVREDRNVKIAYPDAKRPKGVSVPSTAFRVQCKVNGEPFSGDDFCATKLEAEHYAATVALYRLSKGRPLHRMLPPAYREVWMELEEADKAQNTNSQRQVDGEKVGFLQNLIAVFKAEGLMKKGGAAQCAADSNGDSRPETPSQAGQQRSGRATRIRPPQRNAAMRKQREVLPVAAYQDRIAELVRKHRVVIISGDTGCGKSTQVPQFLLEELVKDEQAAAERAGSGVASAWDDEVEDVQAAGRVGGQIFCCQPRRISATSIAARVAREWGDPRVGDTVGYSVKLESKVSNKTRLVFCTTGILLRRLESDPMLTGISTVIVDEVHERSLDSDFLLVMLKALLDKRDDLKVVLMSATMKEAEFSSFFGGVSVLTVPGRTFPVDRMFLEDVILRCRFTPTQDEYLRTTYAVQRKAVSGKNTYWEEQVQSFAEDDSKYLADYPPAVRKSALRMDPTTINYELIEKLVRHILEHSGDEFNDASATHGHDGQENEDDAAVESEDAGAILVFLPGMGEIRRAYDRLSRIPGAHVLPLHSSLSPAQQSAVFRAPPRGMRKVVLSTNIAETGVTIPDVVYVIDSGKAKVTSYDEKKHVTRLRETFITKANCRQRMGRAGRVRPGFYFALYSRHRFEFQMADYETPEIQRIALESTCLRIKVYEFEHIVATFQSFLDPPPTSRVKTAIARLQASRALDDLEQLTPLGRFLGQMPLDVELGKIIAFGAFYGCLDPAVTIAAYLSASVNLFEGGSWNGGGSGGMQTVGSIPRDLLYGQSDLLGYYNIYREWKHRIKNGGAGKARAFCTKYGLSYKALTVLDDTRAQLQQLVPVPWDECNRYATSVDMVHTALLAASYPNVLKLVPGSGFTSMRGSASLHGSSVFAGETAAAVTAAMSAHGLLTPGVPVSAAAIAAAAATMPGGLMPGASPWFCYFSCLHTATTLQVFDATHVHPLLFLVAVGCRSPLATNYLARTVTFDRDGFVKVKVPPKTAAHMRELHTLLDDAFEAFLRNPREYGKADVVAAVHDLVVAPGATTGALTTSTGVLHA
ncbi:hypothetical protein AMAG_15834 [Allomyces macrogynus ATCC 38327]|uniref:ATP-dependent helicase HrpA n=1 Tax=Allomyces macrogynus (strain ATCC 38327) TaxID=578462 RepID=A0A0L0T8U1_ALLM3|nr:hypothetical protein AMAG_15834 [Allomyces macrogynus ATCC 38327]|eukprot:KNE71172.1 hypothetical protein AMAG_15834 [Allomyces macrogynus ATCC 38327]